MKILLAFNRKCSLYLFLIVFSNSVLGQGVFNEAFISCKTDGIDEFVLNRHIFTAGKIYAAYSKRMNTRLSKELGSKEFSIHLKIDSLGTVSDFELSGDSLSNNIRRRIFLFTKDLPKFNPATLDGLPVKTTYSLDSKLIKNTRYLLPSDQDYSVPSIDSCFVEGSSFPNCPLIAYLRENFNKYYVIPDSPVFGEFFWILKVDSNGNASTYQMPKGFPQPSIDGLKRFEKALPDITPAKFNGESVDFLVMLRITLVHPDTIYSPKRKSNGYNMGKIK